MVMVEYIRIIKKRKEESMKKLIALAICLGFILSVSAAYAAPVGNIAAPSILKKGLVMKDEKSDWGIIADANTDLTWDMNLKRQDNDTEYYFYGSKIGLLLMNRFIPYAVLGGGEAKKQTFKINSDKVRWQTDFDFVWAVGGTALIYSTEPGQVGEGILSFGADGSYRQSHLKLDSVVLNGVSHKKDAPEMTSAKYELEQWQIALEVAYEYKQIVPYVGAKYSDATGEATATISGSSFKNDFENEDNVGIFVGSDILINDSMTLNVEGRFIDETALSLAGTVRF